MGQERDKVGVGGGGQWQIALRLYRRTYNIKILIIMFEFTSYRSVCNSLLNLNKRYLMINITFIIILLWCTNMVLHNNLINVC